MFTITGIPYYSTSVLAVTWRDGVLSGDAALVSLIEGRARALEGTSVGPEEGPYTLHEHLRDPLSALMLMRACFPFDQQIVTGNYPTRPPLEPGDIG
jgi:hypothetical protein